MAGAGTYEGFIHILVPERTHGLGSAEFPHVPSVCGLTLPQPYSWALRGSIPGGNTWTAGIPTEPAEAKRPLQPSLGSPMASFLAYSIGEGSYKAIRLKGREKGPQFRMLFSDHHSRVCTQHWCPPGRLGAGLLCC